MKEYKNNYLNVNDKNNNAYDTVNNIYNNYFQSNIIKPDNANSHKNNIKINLLKTTSNNKSYRNLHINTNNINYKFNNINLIKNNTNNSINCSKIKSRRNLNNNINHENLLKQARKNIETDNREDFVDIHNLKGKIIKSNLSSKKIFDFNYNTSIIDFTKDIEHKKYSQTSLFLFKKNNLFRILCFSIATSFFFDIFFMINIIAHSLVMAFSKTYISYYYITLEYYFFFVYLFEFLIKCIAFGFYGSESSYLNNKWTRFYFLLVFFNFFSLIPDVNFTYNSLYNKHSYNYYSDNYCNKLNIKCNFNLYNLRYMQTENQFSFEDFKIFNMFRPLKIIAYVPTLRTLVEMIGNSILKLIKFVVLLLFFYLLFGILGNLLWSGLMSNRCRDTPFPVNGDWKLKKGLENTICGGLFKCPDEVVCGSIINFYDNGLFFFSPLKNLYSERKINELNYGISNFDNILYSMFTVFHVSTLDGWIKVAYIYQNGYNLISGFLYFVLIVIIINYFVTNFNIAIMMESFRQMYNNTNNSDNSINDNYHKQIKEYLDFIDIYNMPLEANIDNDITNNNSKFSIIDSENAKSVKNKLNLAEINNNNNNNNNKNQDFIQTSYNIIKLNKHNDNNINNTINKKDQVEMKVADLIEQDNSNNKLIVSFFKETNNYVKNLSSPCLKMLNNSNKNIDFKKQSLSFNINKFKNKKLLTNEITINKYSNNKSIKINLFHRYKKLTISYVKDLYKNITKNLSFLKDSIYYNNLNYKSYKNKKSKIYSIINYLVNKPLFSYIDYLIKFISIILLSLISTNLTEKVIFNIYICLFFMLIIITTMFITKICSLSSYYIMYKYSNIIKMFVYIIPILEFTINNTTSSCSLYILEIITIFNYLKKWKILGIIIKCFISVVKEMTNYVIIMFLIIYCFALAGRKLFENTLKFNNNFEFDLFYGSSPDMNFDTLADSMLSIFIIFIGEKWNVLFFNCLTSQVTKKFWVYIFFSVSVLFLNVIMMNLLIAFLVFHFQESRVKYNKELEYNNTLKKLKENKVKRTKSFSFKHLNETKTYFDIYTTDVALEYEESMIDFDSKKNNLNYKKSGVVANYIKSSSTSKLNHNNTGFTFGNKDTLKYILQKSKSSFSNNVPIINKNLTSLKSKNYYSMLNTNNNLKYFDEDINILNVINLLYNKNKTTECLYKYNSSSFLFTRLQQNYNSTFKSLFYNYYSNSIMFNYDYIYKNNVINKSKGNIDSFIIERSYLKNFKYNYFFSRCSIQASRCINTDKLKFNYIVKENDYIENYDFDNSFDSDYNEKKKEESNYLKKINKKEYCINKYNSFEYLQNNKLFNNKSKNIIFTNNDEYNYNNLNKLQSNNKFNNNINNNYIQDNFLTKDYSPDKRLNNISTNKNSSPIKAISSLINNQLNSRLNIIHELNNKEGNSSIYNTTESNNIRSNLSINNSSILSDDYKANNMSLKSNIIKYADLANKKLNYDNENLNSNRNSINSYINNFVLNKNKYPDKNENMFLTNIITNNSNYNRNSNKCLINQCVNNFELKNSKENGSIIANNNISSNFSNIPLNNDNGIEYNGSYIIYNTNNKSSKKSMLVESELDLNGRNIISFLPIKKINYLNSSIQADNASLILENSWDNNKESIIKHIKSYSFNKYYKCNKKDISYNYKDANNQYNKNKFNVKNNKYENKKISKSSRPYTEEPITYSSKTRFKKNNKQCLSIFARSESYDPYRLGLFNPNQFYNNNNNVKYNFKNNLINARQSIHSVKTINNKNNELSLEYNNKNLYSNRITFNKHTYNKLINSYKKNKFIEICKDINNSNILTNNNKSNTSVKKTNYNLLKKLSSNNISNLISSNLMQFRYKVSNSVYLKDDDKLRLSNNTNFNINENKNKFSLLSINNISIIKYQNSLLKIKANNKKNNNNSKPNISKLIQINTSSLKFKNDKENKIRKSLYKAIDDSTTFNIIIYIAIGACVIMLILKSSYNERNSAKEICIIIIDYITTWIFLFEMIIKIKSRGFFSYRLYDKLDNSNTYLSNKLSNNKLVKQNTILNKNNFSNLNIKTNIKEHIDISCNDSNYNNISKYSRQDNNNNIICNNKANDNSKSVILKQFDARETIINVYNSSVDSYSNNCSSINNNKLKCSNELSCEESNNIQKNYSNIRSKDISNLKSSYKNKKTSFIDSANNLEESYYLKKKCNYNSNTKQLSRYNKSTKSLLLPKEIDESVRFKNKPYFKNVFNILDFCILIASLINFFYSISNPYPEKDSIKDPFFYKISLNNLMSLKAIRILIIIVEKKSLAVIGKSILKSVSFVISMFAISFVFITVFALITTTYFRGILGRCVFNSGDLIVYETYIKEIISIEYKNNNNNNYYDLSEINLFLLQNNNIKSFYNKNNFNYFDKNINFNKINLNNSSFYSAFLVENYILINNLNYNNEFIYHNGKRVEYNIKHINNNIKFYSLKDILSIKEYTNIQTYDKLSCEHDGGLWKRDTFNFDTLSNALIVLFETATLEGWVDIAFKVSKSKYVQTTLFFIIYVVIACIFIMNLSVCAIVDNFINVNFSHEGFHKLNENQRDWIKMLQVFLREKPKRNLKQLLFLINYKYIKHNNKEKNIRKSLTNLLIKRKRTSIVDNDFCSDVYKLNKRFDLKTSNNKSKGYNNSLRSKLLIIISSKTFEYFILSIIVINSINYLAVYESSSIAYKNAQSAIFYLCCFIFTVEICLKLYVLRKIYFYNSWNIWNLSVVLTSLIGILINVIVYYIEDVNELKKSTIISYNYNTNYSKFKLSKVIIRFLRVFLYLRIVELSNNLKEYLIYIAQILPKLVNITILLLINITIYALIGSVLFETLINGEFINKNNNFKNFINALLLLIRCNTGEDWQNIMHEVASRDKNCYDYQSPKHLEDNGPLGCGSYVSYFYFVSYIILNSLIFLNLFIAVVVDSFLNYNSEILFSSNKLSLSIINKFYEYWTYYDADLKLAIPFQKAVLLIIDLEKYLKINISQLINVKLDKNNFFQSYYSNATKPNELKLASAKSLTAEYSYLNNKLYNASKICNKEIFVNHNCSVIINNSQCLTLLKILDLYCNKLTGKVHIIDLIKLIVVINQKIETKESPLDLQYYGPDEIKSYVSRITNKYSKEYNKLYSINKKELAVEYMIKNSFLKLYKLWKLYKKRMYTKFK